MTRYRAALVWSLRGLAAVSLVLGAVYAHSLIAQQQPEANFALLLDTVLSAFVVSFAALTISEAVALQDARPNLLSFGQGLVWIMRLAAAASFVVVLPTLVGGIRAIIESAALGEAGVLGVLQSSAFTLTALLSRPLLFLGFSELLSYASRTHRLHGYEQ